MRPSFVSVSVMVLGLVLVGVPAETSGEQRIRLELKDGRVTLDATGASPSAILAEWTRVGGTRIVDGERVPGMPLTLRLEGVPEREALDIILRGAAGYIAAARPAGGAGASTFDRIVVMPVSVNAAAARSGPAPAAAAPVAMAPPMPEAVVNAPDVSQDVGDQPVQTDAVEQPVSSTEFDYANPQRYFAARAAQQREAEAAAQGDATAGGDEQPANVAMPGGFSTGTVLSAPGTIPVPQTPAPAGGAPANQQAPANPYGLPADGPAPGSSTAPPMEPDRSKYINPYSPTPTRPPGQ